MAGEHASWNMSRIISFIGFFRVSGREIGIIETTYNKPVIES
jgi:hypothetical protein